MIGLEEWGLALQRTLEGQLAARSLSAVAVVFAAGVLTSFTPCVYPMIPVTVTFIGGAASGNRWRALSLSGVYVLGLASVYAALGVLAAMLGEKFGSFTHTPWIFVAVGAVFAHFGAVMLDWIRIPVPMLVGQAQARGARRGGHLGAALIGAASGFVAAPCTAPVLGTLLLYVSQTRDAVWGGSLMLVFALGLSLLLMVVGIFSGLLANLPRAGAWMNRVKTVFGVGMLLAAGYFFFQAAMI